MKPESIPLEDLLNKLIQKLAGLEARVSALEHGGVLERPKEKVKEPDDHLSERE